MSEINEVFLTDDQRHALEEAMRWESEALAELGAAELQRRKIEEALADAANRVDIAASNARNASAQCGNVLRTLSRILGLPPGEWIYDKGAGKLVLKEKRDA